MATSVTIHDPVATQDATTKAWTHTADLTLPDGSPGHLEQVKSDVEQQYLEALVGSDVVPEKRENGAAGPVTHTDVTRLLGALAAGEQYAALVAAQGSATPPTTYTGQDLTT